MRKEIKKGWVEMQIENILAPNEKGVILGQGWSPQCEKQPSQSENDWGVLKTTAIQSGYFLEEENKLLPSHLEPRTQHEVNKGDLLITCAGPRNRCGVACLVRKTRKKLLISGKMYRFRVNEKKAVPEFIELFLLSQEAWKEIDKMKTGGSDSGLNLTHTRFKKLIIPIPPLPEQQAIVAKIEELLSDLESGKQQLQTAQQQLKVYRQSLLKWAFEGKLTNKNVKAGELPKGWKWVKLGSVASKITDGEHITPRRTSEGYLLLSARNIQNGYLALDNVDYVPADEYERIIKRCNPEHGDILISCSGSIGRVCRVPINLKFTMVRSVALVKFDLDKYSSKFYEYLFQSPLLQRQIEKSKKATAQANLFLGPIKNLDVIVCPIEEQQLIVSELESKLTVCDKIEETISQSLQQAETLRQSILKKAFEGKLVQAEVFTGKKKELA